MLLALDDTDGPKGGCTSHAALVVRDALAAAGFASRGPPRLVRLNPNVPHKTRGNAAAVLELEGDAGPAADIAWEIVHGIAQATAHPAVVAVDLPPPASWYWQAVRTRLDSTVARDALAAAGAETRTLGDGRALSGCLGALAWPGPPTSHELTFYREARSWGTRRRIDAGPLRGLDEKGLTFHTWDPDEDRLCAAPHTPCPVLFGVRGRDPVRLAAEADAIAAAAGERIAMQALWATNQGSGDHVTAIATLRDAPEWSTLRISATVAAPARAGVGGHVRIALRDDAGAPFEAAAFEPTRGLRGIVRSLRPGDELEVVGAWDGVLKLEKVRIVSARRKVANPACACGRRMRSRGHGAGFACGCGARAAPGSEIWDESGLEGWHEVPVLARRHLHRPVAWDDAPTLSSVG